MTSPIRPVIPEDIQILQGLYQRKAELAQAPVMAERWQLWTRLNSRSVNGDALPRPMILAETQGVLDELIPLNSLRCQADWARQMERSLREVIFRVEQVKDDWVVEPWIDYGWSVSFGSYV